MNTRSKRYLIAAICILFVLATNSIYLRLYFQTPPAHQYTGLGFEAISDKLVYYSMIQQGAAGRLFMQTVQTSEPQEGFLFSPHWYLIGQTMRFAHIPVAASYHLFRVLAILCFLFIFWKLIRELFSDAPSRIVAYAATLFASGLGWVYLVVHPERALRSGTHWLYYFKTIPADLYVTEMSAFTNALQSPLFILSHVLILAVWILFYHRAKRRWLVYTSLSGVAAFLVAIHPYDAYILLSVTGSLAIWEYASERTTEGLRRCISVALGTGFALLYHLVALMMEPALHGWLAQNIVFSPGAESYLWALGITGPLSLLGLYFFIQTRERSVWWRLIIVWAASIALAVYLPTGLNRRFSNTWLIPMSLLSYYGIRSLLRRVRSFILYGAIVISCAILLFSGTLYQLAQGLLYEPGSDERYYYYLDPSLTETLSILRGRVGYHDILLTNEPFIGTLFAGYMPIRLYVGRSDQTINVMLKKQQADWFFAEPQTENSLARRSSFLKDNAISTIVLYKPSMRTSFTWLDAFPGLQLMHDSAAIRIYTVHP